MLNNVPQYDAEEKHAFREEIIRISKENQKRWDKIKQETEKTLKELEDKYQK